jgi:hypothetical protein
VKKVNIGGIAVGSLAIVCFGVPVAVVIGVLALAVIAAVCWTICDRERSDRLALLISAVRARPAAGEPPVTVPPADLSTEGSRGRQVRGRFTLRAGQPGKAPAKIAV